MSSWEQDTGANTFLLCHYRPDFALTPRASPEGPQVRCVTCNHTTVNFTKMTARCLPGTAASQKMSGTRGCGRVLIFLVVCRNKHFNRSIAESDFYPLWPSVTQAEKKLWKRYSGPIFSCLEKKKWKSRKGVQEVEQTEKAPCGQRMENIKNLESQNNCSNKL